MNIDFVKGDFVRLKHPENVRLSSIYKTGSPNAFEISKIEGNSVELKFVHEVIPISEIEAIPVNGIDDQSIYYDPVIAASFIASGQSIPVHNRDYTYYLDSFKMDNIGETTLYEVIRKQEYEAVHEIQHFLRKKYHSDDLRIKYY